MPSVPMDFGRHSMTPAIMVMPQTVQASISFSGLGRPTT